MPSSTETTLTIERETVGEEKKTGAPDKPHEPSEKLGSITLTFLVIANMIGAGAFTTSGFALADLGSPNRVMAAWLVGGIIAICGALSYGALVSRIAESGGEYLFLSRILHPMAGFIAGCVSLVAGFTGAIAFAALALETYLRPAIPFELPSGSLAIGSVLVAAALHGVRLGVGSTIQNLVVGIKLLLLLIFIGIAVKGSTSFAVPSVAYEQVSSFSMFAFASSLVWISLSYSGYNAAVYIAGEAKEKRKVVPRAMWIGTILVTGFYLALNAVFVYMVPPDLIAGRADVAAVAADYIGGERLAILIRSIITLSLLTSVFAMVMIGPRVYARMAEDKLFPSLFRFRGEVPTAAVGLQAAAVILLISFSTLKDLLSYLGFTLSLSAAMTVFCVFLIRTKAGYSSPSPVYLIVSAFFVIATVALAAMSALRNPAEITWSVTTFVVGACLYLVIRPRVAS